MSYLPKATVEEGIKCRVRKDRFGKEHTDYEAYFGTDPFTKSAVRKTRSNRDELLKDIKDFYLRHQSGGDAAVRLTAMQALDAKNALDELSASGMSISLTDAVRAFLGGSARVLSHDATKTVGAAYNEWLKYLKGAHLNKAVATTGKWVDEYGSDKKLALVTAAEILKYLEKHYAARKEKTYNSHLLYLKTFFNWCKRDERKYIEESPIKCMAMKEEPWEEPEYMKPDDVERLFRLLESKKDERPDMLAYAITNFFCGSRAVEIGRMAELDDAAKINLEDDTVRIAKGKGFQRGRRPRAFCIEPQAKAWMASFDFLSGIKCITSDTQKDMYKLARANKIPVFQNCGRHTFITYHVSAYGDPAKTQAIVGTSAKMRAENYCGLASRKDGEAFFRILPKPSITDLEY